MTRLLRWLRAALRVGPRRAGWVLDYEDHERCAGRRR